MFRVLNNNNLTLTEWLPFNPAQMTLNTGAPTPVTSQATSLCVSKMAPVQTFLPSNA